MPKTLRFAPLLALAFAALASAAPGEGEGRAKNEDEAVLAELDAALSSQAPFKTVVTYTCQELEVTGKLTIHYAPQAGRLYLRRTGTSPRPTETFALIEPGSATYWSDKGGQRYTYDLEPVLKYLRASMSAMALSRGAPEQTSEGLAAKVGAELQIGIRARAMETRPELWAGLGLSTLSRSSWTAELRDASKRKLVVSAKEVQAEREGGWSYVIDRKTGLFRSQRLVLQSSTFVLEAGSLEAAEFPKVEPPAAITTRELPVHLFVSMLRALVLDSLSTGVGDAEGEALARVAKAYTRLAASAAEARLQHFARSEARRHVTFRLESGATLDALRSNLDLEVKRFAQHLGKALRAIEQEETRELAIIRQTVLKGVAAGSPRSKALSAALDPERVRATRGKLGSAKSHLEAVLATLR